MIWLWGKKRSIELKNKEEEIKKIQLDTQRKAEKAVKEIEKVNKLIEDNPGGIAELIFYATGGYRRDK